MQGVSVYKGEFMLNRPQLKTISENDLLRRMFINYEKSNKDELTLLKVTGKEDYRQGQLSPDSLTEFLDSYVKENKGAIFLEERFPSTKTSILDSTVLGDFPAEQMSLGLLSQLLEGRIKLITLVRYTEIHLNKSEIFNEELLGLLDSIQLGEYLPYDKLVNETMYARELTYQGNRAELGKYLSLILISLALHEEQDTNVSIIMDKTRRASLSDAINLGFDIKFTTAIGEHLSSTLDDFNTFINSIHRNDIYTIEAVKNLNKSFFGEHQIKLMEDFINGSYKNFKAKIEEVNKLNNQGTTDDLFPKPIIKEEPLEPWYEQLKKL